MSPSLVVLVLQVAVIAVTVLFAASIVAVATGHRKTHGVLNTIFFALTLAAVIGLEVVVRLLWPEVSTAFFDPAGPYRRPLLIHLCFSVPAALVLPVMLYTGKRHRGATHRALASLFVILWVGTVVTGVFYLPGGTVGTAEVAAIK